MKKLIIAIIAGLLLAASAFSQTVTEVLVRIQSDPPQKTATAFFEKTIVVDGTTFQQPWQSVTWKADSDKTVKVNGKTYTYSEINAAVAAIAVQEKEAQSEPPPAG